MNNSLTKKIFLGALGGSIICLLVLISMHSSGTTNVQTADVVNTNTAIVANVNSAVVTNLNSENKNTNSSAQTNTNTASPENTNTAVPTNTSTNPPANTNTAKPQNTNTAAPANTNTQPPVQPVQPSQPSGTFSASVSYRVPDSNDSMTVQVTLSNGVVTAASVTHGATSRTSAEYNSAFDAGYKSKVIGKNISSISLSRVSGASLTSAAFNRAIASIQTQL